MNDQRLEPTRRGWPASFRALRNRDFRVLWIGLVISAVGTWMQIIALSLLVLKLTHGSAFALGCVSLSQALAFFSFSLVGGGFADRVDRRRLLLTTQTGLMALAALLGVLSRAEAIGVPLIAACAFASGVILSFDQPARAALISTLVPQEDLLNAIGLQSAVFNAAAVAGPALAGMTAALIGIPANFFFNALSYGGVLVALLTIGSSPSVQRQREKLSRQVRASLRVVKDDPVLFPLLCVYGTLLFAGPSLPLLVPVLGTAKLHVGPAGMGVLFSAAGIGSVAAALLVGSYATTTKWLVPAAVGCWCAALAITGASSIAALTFCSLFLLGAAQSATGAITSSLLQTRVPADQRGRVMSLNTLLLMGVRPLGDFPAGAAIASFGAPRAALGSSALVALTAIAVFSGRREIRPKP